MATPMCLAKNIAMLSKGIEKGLLNGAMSLLITLAFTLQVQSMAKREI